MTRYHLPTPLYEMWPWLMALLSWAFYHLHWPVLGAVLLVYAFYVLGCRVYCSWTETKSLEAEDEYFG
jgi:hypothetical protein